MNYELRVTKSRFKIKLTHAREGTPEVGNNKTTIELNGKRYDALTGELLGDSVAAPVKNQHKPHTKRRSIEGVRKVAGPTAEAKPAVHNTPAALGPTPKKPVMDIRRPAVHPTRHHAQQHSKILMRASVKKPTASLKSQVKVQMRTDILTKAPSLDILPKLSFNNVDPHRLARAKRIAKSKLISKFGQVQPSATSTITRPVPAATVQSAAVSMAPAQVSRPVSAASHGHTMDIFEQALRRANSHEQPPVEPKKQKRIRNLSKHKSRRSHRGASIAASALALLLIAGFVTYQNKANIMLHVASAQAGFHASLPSSKPAGFSIGKFSYSPGAVAVNFDNKNGAAFNIVEEPSKWDSQGLLESFVAANDKAYQKVSVAGRTVYIYNDNSATWVDSGVWYQINDNGNLSTNQIMDIAGSM